MFSDFDARIVRQDSCGVKFNSIIGDKVGELWYDTPRHPTISMEEALQLPLELNRDADVAWKEMGILRDHIVRPGDSVIECGCHHGLTTIMLASWIGPDGFIKAFDAVLFNALIAKRNLEINGITNAAVYCAAIGGKRRITNYDPGSDGSNVVIQAGRESSALSTVMVTLADVVKGRVDALKLDVEGAELEILETSHDLLRYIPRLAIEVHTDLMPRGSVDRIFILLRKRPLYVLWEDGRYERYANQPLSAEPRFHLFSY